MYFAMNSLHLKPHETIWEIPMSQIMLMVRQAKLESDPKTAWSFSDEEFMERIKAAGY